MSLPLFLCLPSFPPSFRLFFYPLVFIRLSLSRSLCPSLSPRVHSSHSTLLPLSLFVPSSSYLSRVCVSFARRDAYREYYSPSDVAHVLLFSLSLPRFINPEGRARDIDIAAYDRGPIRWTPSLRASLRSFSPIFIPIIRIQKRKRKEKKNR